MEEIDRYIRAVTQPPLERKSVQLLKKLLIKILRKSPATLELVMDVCTDLILERTEKNFDLMLLTEKIAADYAADQMKDMILNS